VRRNLRLGEATGAEIVQVPRVELLPVVLQDQRIRYREEGAMVIPPGGSDAVGTLGYVDAGLELAEQIERGAAPEPDVVHVACGTMGTAAGMAVGFALAGRPIRVRTVRVVGRIVTGEGRMRSLARTTLRLLRRKGIQVPPDAAATDLLEMDHRRLGPGYGEPTVEGRKAMERFAGEGIELDDTYTGKAAAGFLASVEEESERRHLFWHTLSATLPEGPDHVG
jgi:1-aminocyclopropane-1-carboxylate deaminase/D-cysteine desulfhydrase-like pyridoxal-dependent ACC family enzyme